jgi:hypothetical protein
VYFTNFLSFISTPVIVVMSSTYIFQFLRPLKCVSRVKALSAFILQCFWASDELNIVSMKPDTFLNFNNKGSALSPKADVTC